MQLLDLLKPTARDVERLALRETDPALARRFEPLTPGPLVAALALAGIALAGIAVAPFRLLARLVRERS